MEFLLDFVVLFLIVLLKYNDYTNFDVLKYIKSLFNISRVVYFEDTTKNITRKFNREIELHFFMSWYRVSTLDI